MKLTSNLWIVTIVGTAIGTVLATWFLALHWSDVQPYLTPVWVYLRGTTLVPRWQLLVLVAALLGFALPYLWRYRGVFKAELSVAVVGPKGPPKAPPVVFAPEQFELTPPRCRALLTLLHRVDSKTTLHDLHTRVMGDVATAVVKPISKGELQHDMEEAERLGLVSIDRVGQYTQYYNLTMPKGRDWVLSKEDEMRVEGSKGLIRRDPRAPGR